MGMYKDFYQMKIEAFGNLPLLKVFFKSKTHKSGWQYLLYGISSEESFLIVTGDYGMGKTTLCVGLIRMLKKKENLPFAYISTPNYAFENIISEVADKLGITPTGEEASTLAMIYQHFRDQKKPQGFYIIIDDAHDLDISSLEKLRSLANFNHNGFFPFRFIFFAHSSFLDKLKAPSLIPLDQRFKRRNHLNHFNLQEVKEYIFSRLYKSGAPGKPTFTENALQKIYNHSQGIPRLINNICDACLLIGASKRLLEINSAVVSETLKSVPGQYYKQKPDRFVRLEKTEPEAVIETRETSKKEEKGEKPEFLKLNLTLPDPEEAAWKKRVIKKPKNLYLIAGIVGGLILLIFLILLIINLFLKIGDLTSSGKTFFDAQNTSEVRRPFARADDDSGESISKYRYIPNSSAGSDRDYPNTSPKIRSNLIPNNADRRLDRFETEDLSQPAQDPMASRQQSAAPLGASYPYSIYLGSYRTHEKAQNEIAPYLRNGLSPYIVKVHLKQKGTWWRIYLGHFQTYGQGMQAKNRLGLEDSSIKNTAYANFIGTYSSERSMTEMFQHLKRFGYDPYFIKSVQGPHNLYAGAFVSKSAADKHNQQLLADGIKSRVVER